MLKLLYFTRVRNCNKVWLLKVSQYEILLGQDVCTSVEKDEKSQQLLVIYGEDFPMDFQLRQVLKSMVSAAYNNP